MGNITPSVLTLFLTQKLPICLESNSWIFNETDVSSFKNHFFYPSLRKISSVDLEEALKPFEKLNADFWKKLRNFIPNEWKTAEIDTIGNHINQIIEHLTEFKEEIWTKLIKP